MIEIQNVILCRSESICSMTNDFRFIIETLNRPIINWQMKIAEDVFLMASHKPGKISHWF